MRVNHTGGSTVVPIVATGKVDAIDAAMDVLEAQVRAGLIRRPLVALDRWVTFQGNGRWVTWYRDTTTDGAPESVA